MKKAVDVRSLVALNKKLLKRNSKITRQLKNAVYQYSYYIRNRWARNKTRLLYFKKLSLLYTCYARILKFSKLRVYGKNKKCIMRLSQQECRNLARMLSGRKKRELVFLKPRQITALKAMLNGRIHARAK